MAPRANWKGFLKVGQVVCQIALYTAASTSERIAFHTINRATGHRVRRQFVDSETGDPVDGDDQIKGYEVAPDDYVTLEPEEITAAVPDGDKTLSVSAFIRCADIDKLYFDRPYYLAPVDRYAQEAYVLIREGMKATKVAALAEALLFRRVRKLLIWPQDDGLVATTLNFNYEVRPAADVSDEVPESRIEDEMLDLARHIIKTKAGTFDPGAFHDRYEAALAELVKAKIEGRTIKAPRRREPEKVVDLMAVLRESAELAERKPPAPTKKPASRGTRKAKAAPNKAKAAPPRKAG